MMKDTNIKNNFSSSLTRTFFIGWLTAMLVLFLPLVTTAQVEKIVFSTCRSGCNSFNELFLMNPNGSGQVNLSNTPNEVELEPTISPDGSKIAFSDVEIKVAREGKPPLSITQVPRLQKGDVLKVRLLDEIINGMKPDQTNFDWTFLVAYLNPARNNDAEKTVSEEIQFRKRGWYDEYSFIVPYDSQPIFFLYTKPNNRAKILKMIEKNQDELRKVGEKTIELADAYGKIGSFLNELQTVIQRNSYRGFGNNGINNRPVYNGYPNYNNNNLIRNNPNDGFNQALFQEQLVEGLAKSFNIELPGCWRGNNFNNFNNYGGYNNYGGNNNYGGYNNYPNYGNYGSSSLSNEFLSRLQCVARSIRLEDYDASISQMLQQGGIIVASQLAQKYPQFAHWINIAAVAIDFILKLTRRTPLRLVPTVTSTTQGQYAYNQPNYGYQQQNYQNNFAANQANQANANVANANNAPTKISVYAESSPRDNGFVSAYPIVTHKWQAAADPDTIELPTPILMDECLHPGQNVIRSTDLLNDPLADNFTRDFKLLISAPNGFRKEFPLKKNLGLSGWELNITKEDLQAIPKIKMELEAQITGIRGFNEIRSPKFEIPVGIGNSWEISSDSARTFAVGERRNITLKNRLGSCRCLQAVIYKPSFGGQFVFDANGKENGLIFSEDGKEVSFEIDTKTFTAGEGKLEIKQSGGEVSTLNLTLYPEPPKIENVKISKGSNQAIVTGERLNQIQALLINSKRAVPDAENTPNERSFTFENSTARQESAIITVVLELENKRTYPIQKTFTLSPARPAIATNEKGEVDATAIENGKLKMDSASVNSKNGKPPAKNYQLSTINYQLLSLFPIDTPEIALSVQNILTDYDFKQENLRIEVRVENAQLNPGDLPKVSFEVLDWKNLKISFLFNQELQKFLGGKRLQFRIRDKLRGTSDWFTISQTFVRTPKISSFKCTVKSCELKGTGIEYISQISVDGGKIWFPESPATLVVQPTADGLQQVSIPRQSNQNQLRIRLRDFPKSDVGGMAF